MSKINVLDSSVYNLISAGEVVENPASIVKELVENCIDAAAQNITVSIEKGGIKSIIIIDDGMGIPADELEKTVLAHATSKIKDANDLNTISTLGFRGEALASIAAVSEVEIKSKYIDSDIAKMIIVKGSQIIASRTTSINKGTSVNVRNLFYNTPARFKFLKTEKSEEKKVTAIVKNLALANPLIAFKYIVDGKIEFISLGQGLEQCAQAVFDKNVFNSFIGISYKKHNITINGYISNPTVTKNNRNEQTLIINGRVLSNKEIEASIHNAYAHRLMKRCFPVYVIDIIMPFDNIDVNVHPQKAEVRFSDARAVCGTCYNGVKEALENYEADSFNSFIFNQETQTENKLLVNEQIKEEKDVEHEPLIKVSKFKNDNVYIDDCEQIKVSHSLHSSRIIERLETEIKIKNDINILEEAKQVQTQDDFVKDISYKVIGQLFSLFLVIEKDDCLYLIDQHAAHERILYDKMIDAINSDTSASQNLLIPYIYECSYDDFLYLENIAEILTKIGFDILEFGDNSFKISAVPLSLLNIDVKLFLDDLLANKNAKPKQSEALLEDIAKKSCKAAIKSGESLNEKQIEYVMQYFTQNSLPLQCPHGRPTLVKITRKEIEKMFRRII